MKPDLESTRHLLSNARDCAMEMIRCAADILGEANSLSLPENLKREVSDTCSVLADAKHDLIDEILRIEEHVAFSGDSALVDIGTIRRLVQVSSGRLNELNSMVRMLADSGECDNFLPFLLEESIINMEEASAFLDSIPVAATNKQPQGSNSANQDGTSRFRHLLTSDRSFPDKEHRLEIHEVSFKNLRDIAASIVFEEDGSLVLREIDDECRYADDEYCSRFYTITLYVLGPESAEAFYRYFLDPLPVDQSERRHALIAALKQALKDNFCLTLMDSTGCPYQKLSNSIDLS
jgi:hypothetical protein